ncbi:hypothetical protein C8R46DRAFT_991536 [Mycena filopes]|nr:hypothetical protein C8R46DRAFT_991536 [Mycena filopes]
MFSRASRQLPPLHRRLYAVAASSPLSAKDAKKLADWIESPKTLVLPDTLSVERLSDLYITLPTRDGSRRPYQPPKPSEALGYGAHLVFFHPRNPDSALRRDGSDGEFCPPGPFIRRMWAGGSMTWNNDDPLLVGASAVSSATVTQVERKNYSQDSLVYVTQDIKITLAGKTQPSIVEQRSHAYIQKHVVAGRLPKQFRGLPTNPDFEFTFTPSPTMLFRFSALTFNAHSIHIDPVYARTEGYKERLVHGPLTALMMLEVAALRMPGAQFSKFTYRARNPLFVDQPMTIIGMRDNPNAVELWCLDPAGVVGMTGSLELIAK